jgi:hypothetical protein
MQKKVCRNDRRRQVIWSLQQPFARHMSGRAEHLNISIYRVTATAPPGYLQVESRSERCLKRSNPP